MLPMFIFATFLIEKHNRYTKDTDILINNQVKTIMAIKHTKLNSSDKIKDFMHIESYTDFK